ncbi:MAG: PAS domain S-box protein [Tepidisphaera sp.]|nr:PAS domain S-box protein [Tepidisphaera sp.]
MIHVIEAAPVGMIKVDSSGTIVLVNREIERMFQYPRQELLGGQVDVLIPLRYKGSHAALMARYAARPDHRKMGEGRDLTGRRRDGTEFPIDVALNPVETAEGRFVIASVIDVTEQRRSQAELRRLNESLAQKNAELEQFVLTISHDLKSPIVTIMGYIGHLRRDIQVGRDDELPVYAERIEGAAVRLKQKIDDLMRLSRIGREAHCPQEVSLVERAAAAIEARRPEFVQLGASVRLNIEEPTAWCDPQHIDQILDNLLGNAIKYGCTNPSPQICVRSWRAGDEHIGISVEDNGAGIDPRYADRIFDLFWRLPSKAEGTGVGLSIVRRIASLYHGKTWVETSPGNGAKFSVTLPSKPPADSRSGLTPPGERMTT